MRKKDVLNFNVNVYALINPLNDSIFYVGATKFELKYRLSGHMNTRSCGIPKERAAIINGIKKKKLKPEILLLETVHFKDASFTEEFYYNLFTSYGFKLLQKKTSFTYNKTNSERMISDWQVKEWMKRENRKNNLYIVGNHFEIKKSTNP